MIEYPIKILLVDDDEDEYVIINELLSEIENTSFELEWIDNYDVALEKMISNQYDVCLVEYCLEKDNGIELLQKAVKKGCKAPIIMLTEIGSRKVDIEAMEAGVLDYLDKREINSSLLERSIRYAIEHKKRENELKRTYNQLKIQFQERTEQLVRTNEELKREITERQKMEEELQKALEESQRRQTEVASLLKGTSAVLKYQEFEEVARAIFDSCKELIGATAGYVALLSEDGEENEVLFLDPGGLPCKVDPSLPMPIRGLRAEAYHSNKAVYDNDFSNSEWTKYLPDGHVELLNVLFAPLIIEGETVGLIGLANKPGGFTEDNVRIASAFAEFVSIALINSQTLEALEKSEKKLQKISTEQQIILDSVPAMIWYKDTENRIIRVNRTAAESIDMKVEEVKGKSAYELFPDEAEHYYKDDLEVINSGTPKLGIIEQQQTASGEKIWVRTDKVPYRDEHGNINGIIVFSVDITERKLTEEALRKSEEKFRTIFNSANDAIFIHNLEGNFLEVNKVACERLKYSREEFLQMTPMDIDSNEYAKLVPERTKKLQKKGSIIFETAHESKDGTVIPIELSSKVINYEGEKAILSIARDITERKQMEKLLSWEADVNKAIAELSRMIISSESLESISYLVMDYAKKLTKSRFGYVGYIEPKTGNLVCPTMTRDIWNICQVEDKDIVFEEFGGLWGWVLDNSKSLLTNNPQDDFRSSGTPEGHIPVHSFIAAPAMIGDTLVGQVALANANIEYTEKDLELVERLADLYAIAIHRNRTEEELWIKDNAIESSINAIALANLEGNLTYVNSSCLKMWGHEDEKEVIGKSAIEFWYDKAKAHELADALRNKGSWIGEMKAKGKDGRKFDVQVSANLVTNSADKPICMMASFVDITERKRYEEQLQRYTDELEKRNQEVKQFAYIVSHDLRAPLVNLKGFSSELRFALETITSAMEDTLPHLDEEQQRKVTMAIEEDVPESLEFIESSVTQMDKFIQAVLKLSRIGRRELKLERVDMNKVVHSILKTFAHQIDERQVEVTVEELPEIVADRTSIEQIINNLLSNAVKYLVPGRPGVIEITAEDGDDETIFRVRDNGRGIREEDMSKVFAPFRRAGKQEQPGEGMGLSYVQTLVRRHGGRIWCESELDKGTTFSFTISKNIENELDADYSDDTNY